MKIPIDGAIFNFKILTLARVIITTGNNTIQDDHHDSEMIYLGMFYVGSNTVGDRK